MIFGAVLEAGGGRLEIVSMSLSSSPSWSSERVLRFVDVLIAEAATVDEVDEVLAEAAVRVVLGLVVVVSFLEPAAFAAEDAVLEVADLAALARVMRLGGDAGVSIFSC